MEDVERNQEFKRGNEKMKTIAIIPARGGSKRLYGKNIKILCGKPMIAYTIQEAKKSRYIDEVFVTTEDDEIASVSKMYGAKIIKRPDKLATDLATTESVIEHAKKYLGYDMLVVLLQSTSPLRTVEDIDKCIKLYLSNAVDSVVSVCNKLGHEYMVNGAIYVFKDEIWTDNMALYLMPKNKSVDVDTIEDFEIAKIYMENRK